MPTSRLTSIAIAAAMVLAIAMPAAAAHSAPASGGPREPDRARYDVTLRSDRTGFHWRGTERIGFHNGTDAPLALVWVRLWDNGIYGCRDKRIHVWNLTGGSMGAFAVRCSAVPITLAQPVPRGGRGSFAFDVAISVPDRNDRFGHDGPVALVGNALPILAIDDDGGWDLDPYSILGDSFYSQIADWRVAFDHPVALKVPATGVGSDGPVRGDRVTTTYEADRVRDFAWAAGQLGEVTGRDANGVVIRVWYAPEFSHARAESALASAELATESDAASFGPYAYPELDVVVVNLAFGGMEFPTFVMSTPVEGTVVHEVSHQWWYGMVGDDQYKAPWLDEAFATYTQQEVMHPGREACRPRFFAPRERVTDGLDYWDAHPRRYFFVVYYDGSCALHRLTHILGADRMASLLRSYWTAHAFGWSTTEAFQTAAQSISPRDLTAFWARFRIGPP